MCDWKKIDVIARPHSLNSQFIWWSIIYLKIYHGNVETHFESFIRSEKIRIKVHWVRKVLRACVCEFIWSLQYLNTDFIFTNTIYRTFFIDWQTSNIKFLLYFTYHICIATVKLELAAGIQNATQNKISSNNWTFLYGNRSSMMKLTIELNTFCCSPTFCMHIIYDTINLTV